MSDRDDQTWSDDELFDGRADAPRRATEKPRRGRRIFVTILVFVLVALLGYGGYYFFRLNRAVSNLERVETMLPTNRAPEATRAPDANHDPITFVLMGSDARSGDEAARSDTLMVAYLSGNRDHLYLVSFPRDMWVTIPGHGEAKINAAYAYGGAALTVETLESMLETRMDHVVTIDFDGFIKLTEVLGGVTVNNKYESQSGDYYFPQGEITIQGDEALAYVRQREGLPDGDLSRAERQRDVVSAIIDKVVTPEVLANPNRMGAFFDQAADTVTVDAELTDSLIYSLASQIGFSGSDGVRSLQAPILGYDTSADGQAIDVVDWTTMGELATAMQTDSMDQYYQAHAG